MTVSTVAAFPRRHIRKPPIRSRVTRPSMTFRFTALRRPGGAASRLIRSLERSGFGEEVIGGNLAAVRRQRYRQYVDQQASVAPLAPFPIYPYRFVNPI